MSNSSKVVYIYDEILANATCRIPHIGRRAKLVHELINAYHLTDFMDCRPSKNASKEDLLTFHSTAYLSYLYSAEESSKHMSTLISDQDFNEDFGLGYDCPIFANMKEFTFKIAGGTLAAVHAVMEGSSVAINWCGGWHHAQRNEASGFCYVNDIVIGIQELLKTFKRILYIDLDSHHGDGVENAFSYSNKVMTLSFHNYEAGYFPGTGNVNNIGFGRGKFFAVNVPLQSGITDQKYISIFDNVFSKVQSKFHPEVIVVQCGTDCLSGDPLGNFNLSPKSMIKCVQQILQENIPVVFLGGGGYNPKNAAKAWTQLTSVIIGHQICLDIPEHEYFAEYGPDFTLEIPPGLRKNENTEDYINDLLKTLEENLERIPIHPTIISNDDSIREQDKIST